MTVPGISLKPAKAPPPDDRSIVYLVHLDGLRLAGYKGWLTSIELEQALVSNAMTRLCPLLLLAK